MFKNPNGGFIKTVLILIIIILVLSYFGFDIKNFIDSPTTQKNLGYVWGLGKTVWNKYLEKPLTYLWKNVFVNLLWGSFTSNMERIKGGGTITPSNWIPQI